MMRVAAVYDTHGNLPAFEAVLEDAETTTENDITRGVVNILVGFAPLKPAEFVIVRIQQLAGQVRPWSGEPESA